MNWRVSKLFTCPGAVSRAVRACLGEASTRSRVLTALTIGIGLMLATSAPAFTYQIIGSLKDGGGSPITNAQIYASATNDGNVYNVSAITDTYGYYALNVTNGSWTVGATCCACTNGLAGPYYQCPIPQAINIFNDNAVANFVATTVGPPLPNSTLGAFYFARLGNIGFRNSVEGFVADGSLPPGLVLERGTIVGTPSELGTFEFTVEVDFNLGLGIPTRATFTIAITARNLQITTTSFNAGPSGQPFSAQLEALGGTPPYVWSLAPGSAPWPAVLTLSTNGLISGVPATDRVSTVIVNVTDANALTGNAQVQLTVNSAPTILSTAFSSNRGFQFSASASTGQNYTVQYSPGLSNWLSLLVTNPPTSPFIILDPGATDQSRYYRLLLEPH